MATMTTFLKLGDRLPVSVQKLVELPGQEANSADPQGQAQPPKRPGFVKIALAVGASLLLLGAGIGGYQFLKYASAHEETDDAYTTAHLHTVSPRINDTVLEVLVDDNQHVEAGQTLVLLDPADFQVRFEQALAALEVAKRQAEAASTSIIVASDNAVGKTTTANANVQAALANIEKSRAGLNEAKAAVPRAEAHLAQTIAEEARARNDFMRYDVLAKEGAVPMQQRDQYWSAYEVAKNATISAKKEIEQEHAGVAQAAQALSQAQAGLDQARGSVQEAQSFKSQTVQTTAQYHVAESAIAQAQSQLKDAQLQLSYTKITAPVSGRIGKKNVEAGQRVQPGQALLTIVQDEPWVVANFKETQMEKVRPGESVEISIDSFPHHKFKGTVDSVQPGSGATFALLPPENATGNFTKVVQRVPVKILFDRDSMRGYESLVVPGMSVVANVSVGH